MNKFILRILAIVTSLSLIFLFCSCSKSGKSKGPRKPESVPVTVAAVTQKDIPVQLNTIGSVESYSTISVVSQVGGTLLQVKFQEGQEVKKGDLLFIIDPEPYQLDVQQAEAELERSIAQHAQAEANYARDSVQLENAKVELGSGIVASGSYYPSRL